MKKLILVTALALSLGGCASTQQYTQYTATHQAIAASKASADVARYNALAALANSGSETAKVAAVMALALSNNGGSGQTQNIAPPQTNEAIQWASILVPSLTSIAGMRYNYLSTVAQSNNAVTLAKSTNDAFVGIASKIQAPAANVSTVTTTTTDRHDSSANQTMSGTGVLGTGAYTTSANPISNDDHSVVSPTPIITPVITPAPVTPVIAPTPNVITTTSTVTTTTDSHDTAVDQAMSGTGVLGSGAYDTANQTLSGTGVLGTGAYDTSSNPVTTTTVDDNSVTSPITPPVTAQ